MTTQSAFRLQFVVLTVAALALAGVSHVGAQTTFFSDTFNRASSTNLDDSTNGMGGLLITSGVLAAGNTWEVPVDVAKGNGSNSMIAAGQLRMGGWGNTCYIFPNFNVASLVATGVVTVAVTFTNSGPGGTSTATDNYDRYDGIGVGFSLANGNAGGGTDRWMQNAADLFVDETKSGYILIYDGLASGRNTGANFNLAVPLNGAAGIPYPGTLRIDLMVTNTAQGSNVVYNVLWNGGTGFTNVVTGRSFAWSGNNAFYVGTEDRSAPSITNTSFTISSSSYTPPPISGLTWRATANNNWNTSAINWVDSGLGLSSYAFFTGANVLFNDTTASATVNLAGTVTPGAIIVSNVNSNYVFSGAGAIAGSGSLTKFGSGTLTLGVTGAFTGGTVVSNGTLNITGSLSGSGPVTITPAGTLTGSGTIAGAVTVQAGGLLSPGGASGTPTTLTLQTNLTLAGNLLIQVNKSLAASNDLTIVSGVLTNAGTGTVTFANAGPAFALGDVFKLFSQPLLNGGALTVSPALLGSGQAWSNNLAGDGTIVVVSQGPPADLSSLTVQTPYITCPLTPTFASNIVSYSTSLAYSNKAVTVTPVSVAPSATISIICQGVTYPATSGVASSPIALKPGLNVIDVRVATPGGVTIKDYLVNLTRTPPNVVLILADDQGFSDWGCYGSAISTPNLDNLAATGLRFRNFYNAARCSPTRDSILTGLYTQQAAVDPGASLPPLRTDNNVTIAELLGSMGYHTYMAGKWHIGAGTGQLPENRGFDEVFTYISGSAADENEWDPTAYRFNSTDGETTNIPYAPGVPYTNGSNFYQPDVIGDYCVQYLNNQSTRHTNSPFFMYVPFGTAHFPLAVPPSIADTNVPIYSAGWDVLRYQRYTNMLAMGVIDPRYALSPNEGAPGSSIGGLGVAIPAWNTLSTNQQADLIRRMAIYAGMIEKMDANIGRIVQTLQTNGQLDNTLIFCLSDNGGNYEGGVFGSVGGTSGTILTGTALANMGYSLSSANDIQIGGGWAHVMNTPFRQFKHFDHFGGIGTPLIVHWPQGLTRTNQWENQPGHLIDIMATIVDVTGATYPTHWTNSVIGTNYAVLPLPGQSLVPVFTNSQGAVPRNIGFEHEGNRAYISGNWKYVNKNYTSFDNSSYANELELYNLTNDPSETTNLAFVDLHELAIMVTNWNNWCNFVGDYSSLLITVISNPAPIVYLDPAPSTNDIFLDTFDRPDNVNTSASATGMSGSAVPPIGVNAAYYEGYEGTGQPNCIEISSNALLLAYKTSGAGMAEDGIEYNFDTPDIASAGGFSVELNVQSINSANSDSTNRYAGFGVGMTQAQAAAGNDISQPGSFRGEVGNPGVAAFFVDLNLNGAVEIWTNGILANTIPVGETAGILTAGFACTGFTSNDTVTVNVFFNGEQLNLNAPNTNSMSCTFMWKQSYANYIGLSARATGYVQVDNLAIRKLPLANGLITDYAMSYGLTGTNTAANADPDGDGVSNFAEWAFGGDPTVPDAYIAGFKGIQVMPGNNCIFEFQRYINYAAVGLSYHYFVSPDLVHWTETTPNILGTNINEDKTDYEVVTLQLPSSVTSNAPTLYMRILATTSN